MQFNCLTSMAWKIYAILRETVHTLFQFGIYATIVYLVMDVVILNELIQDHPDGDADQFGLGHVGVEVEIIIINTHVLDDFRGYGTVTMQF